MHSIDSLFKLLVIGPRDIAQIRRWRGPDYRGLPDDARDTTLEHSLSTGIVIAALLAIEESHPEARHKGEFNHARLITAGVIHDLGEGGVGELPWRVKRHPLIKDGMRKVEHEFVGEMFDELPEAAHRALGHAYNIPHQDSLDGRFFDAAHLVGQMALAVTRYKEGHHQFIEAFGNILPALEAEAGEFVSIELCLAPYRAWMAEELAEHARIKAT